MGLFGVSLSHELMCYMSIVKVTMARIKTLKEKREVAVTEAKNSGARNL